MHPSLSSAAGWHAGERALQERAGVAARMAEVGARVLRDFMPEQHREFFGLLPYLVGGTLDAHGQPRVTLLAGAPGFAQSPDPRTLRIEAAPGEMRPGEPIALLGLQAHTGRRNRMNGRVARVSSHGFEVTVGQSFGNCPKYIHAREALHVAGPLASARTERMEALDDAAVRQVSAADTFFIATAHPLARTSGDPSQGLDVSHRGGPAGFVRVDGNALLVPDYVGNSFFNTFGNLELEPRCGLLFVDFGSGECLFVEARAQVLWEGSQRMLRLEVTEVQRVVGGLPLRWEER
jgi:hypothetical protein